MPRNVTPFGEQIIIIAFEGLVLKAYRCPAGILTIGCVSTGPHVKAGMVITRDQALQLLRSDLDRFEIGVERLLKRPAADHEFDAQQNRQGP